MNTIADGRVGPFSIEWTDGTGRAERSRRLAFECGGDRVAQAMLMAIFLANLGTAIGRGEVLAADDGRAVATGHVATVR